MINKFLTEIKSVKMRLWNVWPRLINKTIPFNYLQYYCLMINKFLTEIKFVKMRLWNVWPRLINKTIPFNYLQYYCNWWFSCDFIKILNWNEGHHKAPLSIHTSETNLQEKFHADILFSFTNTTLWNLIHIVAARHTAIKKSYSVYNINQY